MNIERNEQWVEGHGTIRHLHSYAWLRLRRWYNSRSGARQVYIDVLGLLAALSVFLWSGPLLRLWDPTAGVLDVGTLSMLALAAVAVALAKLAATGVYKPMVASFNQLTEWQRALCYGCLYLAYFWAVVWVVVALV